MLKDRHFFFLDLDGCVYIGDTPIKGSREAIAYLKSLGKKVIFITNNATKLPEGYAQKLRSMGIDASSDDIITSGTATAKYLKETYGLLKILSIGPPSLAEALKRQGHTIVPGHRRAQALVVCLDIKFSYKRLTEATTAVLHGAMFIATNADPTVPTEAGPLPGAGAMVAAIATTTGTKPFIVGKPNTTIFTMAMKSFGATPERTVYVGDRMDTDIQGAKQLGAFAILVLTGATTPVQVKSGRQDNRKAPDLIIEDLGHIVELLNRN